MSDDDRQQHDHPSRPGFSARRLRPTAIAAPRTLRFFPPTPPMSENALRGAHWGEFRNQLHPWRDAAYAVAKQEGVAKFPPAEVTVTIPFRTKRRRDPSNYVGTVVKAVVDGLVLAGVWPDDSPEWVTVAEPVIAGPGQVAVELRPIPEIVE